MEPQKITSPRQIGPGYSLVTVDKGITSFFRVNYFHSTFSVIREMVAGASQKLKVMVVGCCTGEEPYSLLMGLAHEKLEDRVEMTALDNCRQSLLFAAKGIYDLSAYAPDAMPAYAQRYFQKITSQEPAFKFYRIADQLKAKVSFRLCDIAIDGAEGPRSKQDIIIINNVWYYLDGKEKEKALDHLAAWLEPGGALLIDQAIDPPDPRFELSATAGVIRKYRLKP